MATAIDTSCEFDLSVMTPPTCECGHNTPRGIQPCGAEATMRAVVRREDDSDGPRHYLLCERCALIWKERAERDGVEWVVLDRL